MTLARIACRAQIGLHAPLVQVEVSLGPGLPAFSIVGLAATVVKESKERVRAALTEFEFRFSRRPYHGESRASGAAEGRRPIRLADCARYSVGFRTNRCGVGLRVSGVLWRVGARRRAQACPRVARGGRQCGCGGPRDHCAEWQCRGSATRLSRVGSRGGSSVGSLCGTSRNGSVAGIRCRSQRIARVALLFGSTRRARTSFRRSAHW